MSTNVLPSAPDRIALHVRDIPRSGIRDFFDIVSTMRDVISLGIGEPDFDTPWRVREASIFALERGATHYTSNLGLLKLRRAICDYVARAYGTAYNADDECLIAVGVSEAMDLAVRALINPGDEVLYHEPCYVSYAPLVRLAHGVPVPVPLSDATGFRLTREALERHVTPRTKMLILNFPNNPCGYTIRRREGEQIVETLLSAARQGARLVTVLDEAYFGLFYTEDLCTESLFGQLANRHGNLLAVKLDGATKEYYVWGFRVGFLTYGAQSDGNLDAVYEALEKKTMGAIRGAISNASHVSQTLILKAMESPEFLPEAREKVAILKRRALRLMEILKNEKYRDAWSVYPFNSGYFMCLQVRGVDGEALRCHLLDRYGVGVIAAGGNDVRVAFSCIEEEDLQELFDTIHRGVMDLRPAAAPPA